MNPLSGQKTRAALVVVSWMVTAMAVWGIGAGGQRALRAVRGDGCGRCNLQGKGIELELAKPAVVDRLLVTGDSSCPAPCMRAGLRAGLREDTFLIIAYVLLMAALFSLSAASRKGRLWITAVGGLVALAAGAADVWENKLLGVIVDTAEAGSPASAATLNQLQRVGGTKWLLIALSAAGIAWLWSLRSRWRWVLRLLAVVVGGLLVGGVLYPKAEWVKAGTVALFAFWTAAMIGAISVAITRDSLPVAPPKGGPP